jgi:HK97 gp10 family phage protein
MRLKLDADALRSFGNELSGKGATIAAAGAAVVQKSTYDGQRLAQARCPVDTGNLRSSISSEFRGGGASVEGEFGPTASYGGYVEDGTSRMAPQPYMGPATDAIEPKFLAAIAKLTEGL